MTQNPEMSAHAKRTVEAAADRRAAPTFTRELSVEEQHSLAYHIARFAHQGQEDKIGVSYINHPVAVANQLTDLKDRIVGYLHDVVEDTPVTFEHLRAAGIDSELVDDVDALTKRPHEPGRNYIGRVAERPRAKRVKHADMNHNTDPARVEKLATVVDTGTFERIVKKYETNRELLNSLT